MRRRVMRKILKEVLQAEENDIGQRTRSTKRN